MTLSQDSTSGDSGRLQSVLMGIQWYRVDLPG